MTPDRDRPNLKKRRYTIETLVEPIDFGPDEPILVPMNHTPFQVEPRWTSGKGMGTRVWIMRRVKTVKVSANW